MVDDKRRTITIAGPRADLFRLRFAFAPLPDPRVAGTLKAVHEFYLRLSVAEERALRERFLGGARAAQLVLIEFTSLAPSSSYQEVVGLISHELMHRASLKPKSSIK